MHKTYHHSVGKRLDIGGGVGGGFGAGFVGDDEGGEGEGGEDEGGEGEGGEGEGGEGEGDGVVQRQQLQHLTQPIIISYSFQ